MNPYRNLELPGDFSFRKALARAQMANNNVIPDDWAFELGARKYNQSLYDAWEAHAARNRDEIAGWKAALEEEEAMVATALLKKQKMDAAQSKRSAGFAKARRNNTFGWRKGLGKPPTKYGLLPRASTVFNSESFNRELNQVLLREEAKWYAKQIEDIDAELNSLLS